MGIVPEVGAGELSMANKYSWVGNKIPESDMAVLYRMKKKSGRPITELVAEAVSQYIKEKPC